MPANGRPTNPHSIAPEDHVKSPATMLAVVLLAATSLQATDGDNHSQASNEALHRYSTSSPADPEPPNTMISRGDPAPNFSYQSVDHQWRNLRDLTAQGNVLLVFRPDDAGLRALEHERESLLGRGIVPVAILDRPDGVTWSLVQRMQLHYSVLADPRCVISAQFNLQDPTAGRALSGWFVIDRSGNVRGLHRAALPAGGYMALATHALGMPGEGVALPASH